jgi:N utilization substance protein A
MAISARTEFASALNQVCSERGLEAEVVLETIKAAILAAYRKDYGEKGDIEVDLDPATGEVKLRENGKDVTPPGFGRIAAQTAKQVILQRISEAEKSAILSELGKKVGTVVSGLIQRVVGPIVIVNLGKGEGILPPSEQVPQEKYQQNQRMKFFIKEIRVGPKGEEIIVSRADKGLIKDLLRTEVPEVNQGIVEIKAIAREAGSRSKVAVFSNQSGVDPVGSCVGQRGVRVGNIIAEIGEERVDIISYDEDPKKFIIAALSPAKDLEVKLKKKKKEAQIIVPEDQLPLAIGKDGQNVRLAAKLTGFRLDIVGPSQPITKKKVPKKKKAKKATEIKTKRSKVEKR